MARLKDREDAIALRLTGMSYTDIKDKLGISKSTLHYWLKDYPLSDERIRELRDFSAQRIERFRATMQRKRDDRLDSVYLQVRKEVGQLTKREFFLTGLFLYWAEGTKASPSTICFTNTDPAMVKFFLKWLESIGVEDAAEKAKVRLHLYADMDVREQTNFWASHLGIPAGNFRKPYIKATQFLKKRNYTGRFGQGTCNVFIYGRDLHERIMMGTKVIREIAENCR